MTDDQLKYSYNAKNSKALCAKLERLLEEADYYEKSLNIHKHELAVLEIDRIKADLNAIWDQQVDLFFKIQSKARTVNKTAVKESFKVLRVNRKYRE